MANLFPTSSVYTAVLTDTSNIDYKGTYAFDFETGEFIRNADGSIKVLSEFEAYVQWCQKAMSTRRYKYRAYTSKFGKDIIGSTLDQDAIELELKRTTQEALMVHPLTKSVDDFTFTWDDSSVDYTYQVTSTKGQTITLSSTEKVG
ncbi:DUF2634 domain-containing protein [Clostridium beijerinckii]|jgi:Protein of unknown function (DUF2634).|uniref:DUF2634 domain-containing protein n=1 Tax=Clostridium beijerinckii TaxID=1520 RepID=UPI001361D600|nr:DUF2634 domain-containing protein [Clostridium beijerinckii]MZK53684.1 DUF2634 domain-containing protein [Clostridium beijerinckii]MZK61813.1 DUF2634 domain-containing protein [Clostridium beijerinckii]MZK71994.1 DUF2634 domain-containing protein [Clostridium beijerinckii]MZK77387.1 DUF2634 domain-containing protein [Clostridium beijerinckii]MZK86965.1 DUF2634 domain-containing protein [Clostridium beijerinckii]